MTSVLSDPRFHDEQAAYEWIEARIWPNGPVCPHCGGVERIGKMGGKSTRIGLYKCYQCRKPFTVKVGTVFEGSHVKMRHWLQAIYLIGSSKKGISSNQLHRTLGVTLKTAWFMAHRIREAMREGVLEPLGGMGKVVEADETYFGKQVDPRPSPQRKGRPYTKGGRSGPSGKRAVLALVERQGRVRTFHVIQATKANVAGLVAANVFKEKPALHRRGPGLCHPPSRRPFRRRVRPGRGSQQHRRVLLLHHQARDARHLPALRREAPSPLPCRV